MGDDLQTMAETLLSLAQEASEPLREKLLDMAKELDALSTRVNLLEFELQYPGDDA